MVIELGVLADGLAGCQVCEIPLHLSHTQEVLHCGLGAFNKVLCQNTLCRHINTVSTGKQHGRIWDASTKLAAGTAA